MSTHNMLGIVLNDILRTITPSQEDWEIRLAIINDLRSTAESVESLRGAIVEPFGSFVSNLFTRWGDLDISIELLNGSHIGSAGRKQKQTLLVNFLQALRMRGGCMNFQLIPNARVPILKFKSVRQGISCDVSINNLPGLMKSKFLLWINKIDGRFHDLVLVVKQWAKAHKINNSKTGSFNSFTLSLLVIFHLQTCAPAILPPLKDIYPTNMVDELRGVRADAENLIAQTCEANINRFISKSRPINRKSLPELFVDFLIKFAQIDSWAAEIGICTYTGEWEQIKNNMRWLPKTSAILVEDPFKQPENSAISVSSGQLKKIAEAFLKTYSLLTSQNQNQSSLLTQLAPPYVSRLIARPVIPNYPNYNVRPAIPNYLGGYSLPTQPQPQVHRGVPPHPRSRQRSQNGKQGASSNGSTSKQGAYSNGSTSKQGPSSNGSTSKQGPSSNGTTSKGGANSNGLTSKQEASFNWTLANQPNFRKVLGQVKQTEAMPPIPSAKKPTQPKAPKPKPKPKNPLDLLPPSKMVLDDWKRLYSNTKTNFREVAVKGFWDMYDPEGYSLWFCDYKYNDENMVSFVTLNKVGGFFQRMDLARKYAFGKMLVIGSEPPFKVKGLWLFRGLEIPKFVMDECYDMELYEWTKVDISDEAQKERASQMIEDAEPFEGEALLDAKCFK